MDSDEKRLSHFTSSLRKNTVYRFGAGANARIERQVTDALALRDYLLTGDAVLKST